MSSCTSNKSICIRPWTHLNFLPNGNVRPCCIMDEEKTIVGNLKTQSLEEIWNSPAMMQLRKDMLEDKKPAWCDRCYRIEESTGSSTRTADNNVFKKELEAVEYHTREDGYNEQFDLIYWDFRFSNKCNLRCRSCGPNFSSAWVPDAKKLWAHDMSITEREKLTNLENVEGKTKLDFIKEHVSKVKQIYFAGGEPLIMDEHYEVLEMLLEAGNTNCNINYNTNLNTLVYKNWNVIDFWNKWPKKNLQIWPSIDEIGERAEFVRKGSDWFKIEMNLKKLVKEGYHIRPNVTTGALNVYRLPEIIAYFFKNDVLDKKQAYLNFNINVIDSPESLHITALPDEFKLKTKIKIENFLTEFKEKTDFDLTSRFNYVLKLLDEPHNPEYKDKFFEFNIKLDGIRNENIFEVIPELKCMLEQP
jgi:radical SAM protein with 4Fe4S-binding SPASM domain